MQPAAAAVRTACATRAHVTPLVEVMTADEREDAPVADRHRQHAARVAFCGRRREAGQVGDAQVARGCGQAFERGCPPEPSTTATS